VHAWVDGQEIAPEEVALDLLRWEGEKSRGSDQLGPQKKAVLHLGLEEADLRAVGAKLHEAYRQYLKEDPRFFEAAHMDDVPRPLSADVFVKSPLALRRYVAADSFWRRKAGEALVAAANPFREGTARWFIERFRDAREEQGILVVELSVRGY
jgi:hypothetical protein